MANRKQLKILKQGVEAWNAWREENPNAKIDLRGAKLDGRDLSGANFRKADIRRASFKNAAISDGIFLESKAGCSFFGTVMQFLLLLVAIIVVFFLLISAYLSSAFLLQYLIIIYNSASLLAIITVFIMLSLIILSFCSFFLIQVAKIQNKMISFIVSVFSLIAFISSSSLFFSFIVCILLTINDGSIKISNVMMPEKLVRIRDGKKVVSIGDANVTVVYMTVSIILFAVIVWRIWCEDPRFAFLRRVGIVMSTLFGTDFRATNLTNSVFNNAILKHTRFGNAILTETSWQGAQGLQVARCNGTILDDRDVRQLLVHRKGEGQSFKGKNLAGAYLAEANLRNTDLCETDLMQANLSKADITGTKLYGSARENWIIDDIRCDYVYWDEAGEERTPPDRDFRPGEFEELYKQLPTFEYIFEQGFTPLDPLVMDRVVQAINERHKEFKLDLVNFDKRGQPHATFTVCQLDFIDTAKEQVSAVYEANRIRPENQDQLMAAFIGLVENQSKLIDKIPSTKELKKMGDTTYNIHGGQFGAVGTGAIATGNTFQQIINDLSRLHEEMQRTASNPEQQAAAQNVAKAEQAARQEDEPTMRQHLKNAGQWTLDCAQKIGTDVVTEYLKKMTTGM